MFHIGPTTKDLNRFFTKIKIDEDTECWNWVRCRDKKGYGRFRWLGTIWQAHRWSYYHLKGRPLKLVNLLKLRARILFQSYRGHILEGKPL